MSLLPPIFEIRLFVKWLVNFENSWLVRQFLDYPVILQIELAKRHFETDFR